MKLDSRLRAYAAFVRRKSFSAAAAELHISQPAVSKHIADLEREAGVKLIERRTRALTEAGEYLAGHVLRAEALLKQVASGLASLRDPLSGAVSIIASGNPGTYVLPRIVAAFQNAHPGVRFQFELATSSGVVDAVAPIEPSSGSPAASLLHRSWKPSRCSRMRSWWPGRRTFHDGSSLATISRS
jgi:DNA-binding transcriptional LysR family regulator